MTEQEKLEKVINGLAVPPFDETPKFARVAAGLPDLQRLQIRAEAIDISEAER